ncbi:hypothetical protein SS1G_10190 [Sclerotinia sclerotiorum 1980 UF-70]|uniref:Carboxylesterase family protein n=2 Tax=Sclerotinia sclerotiorum (strain ATCC 18683 / 1980 / Ss-1) TaxID=665079 RepID=A7EXX5_SCLS1|nr:hypothetical protein SS1G_10190 [Sclerotinia sclerotiorum 1980 UF-70]APA16058.1 hypothetical protein sscle_16g108280 [Sclerotinia sclerotiorum 1980 UF-70]EDN94317.1 hypothetical protein SS1G_10190 [Sclerotinia sclerotiorum 1980 UF-70]
MSRVTNSIKINIAEDNTASIAAQIPLPLTPASKVLATSNAHGLNTMALHDSEDIDLAQHMKNLKAAYRSALGITKKGKKHNKNKTRGKQEYSSEIEHTKGTIQELENSESIVDHSQSIQAITNTGAFSGIIANPSGVRSEISMSNSEPPRILTDQLRSVQPLQIMEQAMFHQLPQSGRTTRGQVARQQAGQYDGGISFPRAADTGDVFWRSPQASSYSPSSFPGPHFLLRTGNLIQQRHEHNTNPYYALAMKNNVKTETKNIEPLTAEKLRSISNENDRPAISVKYPLTKQIKTLEQIERACEAKEVATPARHSSSAQIEEDSFIDIIISRSPAKPVSRIEDSLEELDNLEDAIDALDEATTVEKFVATSTKKVNIPTEVSSDSDSRESLRRGFIEEIPATGLRVRVRGTLASSQRPKSTYATVRVKPTATKEPTLKKAKSMTFESSRPVVSPEKQTTVSPSKVPRPTSLLPPKSPTKSTKPPTKPIFELPGDAVAKRLKEQREARIAQRESSEMTIVKTTPGRIKSTKPPTKSSQFELPGEAYSRRKREAHEARVKAQEEEDRKRREFKARPMSKFVASRTLPRDTAASRARQSKTGGESTDSSGLTVGKRGSIVGAHRPSILDMQKVNVTSSSPRTKAPPAPLTRKPSSHPHNPRVTMQRTVSDSDQELQRQRAKELYNRDAQYTAEIEKEKKDREAAAKRSREEAAEKGRQASREWAERQKAKRISQAMGDASPRGIAFL